METVFLQEKPTIRVVDSTITKALPRDLIIHAVKLTHKGHEWHITVQRHQLRELFKKLKQVRGGVADTGERFSVFNVVELLEIWPPGVISTRDRASPLFRLL